MSADPESDAMWADLHAASAASGAAPVVLGVPTLIVVAFARSAVCGCPACRAARFAAAGCDGCADLGYGPCADHQELGC